MSFELDVDGTVYIMTGSANITLKNCEAMRKLFKEIELHYSESFDTNSEPRAVKKLTVSF